MTHRNIYLGSAEYIPGNKNVTGGFVDINNEKFYKIGNYDTMPDFFMTIVSDSDHWLFLSSNGSLSAGRKNRDNALFPYYTVDKIHDYKGITGNSTVVLVNKNGKTHLWEPFTDCSGHIYNVKRNIYKSIYGNKVLFEEVNNDLEIAFKYGWYFSDAFGLVKKSTVLNLSGSHMEIEVLDGIINILPYGVDYNFQNTYSNLLDAYKKSELLEDARLGLFSLSSIPVDKAEPSESLKTTTVWYCGQHTPEAVLLSQNQIEIFKQGKPVKTEKDIRATRGAYMVNNQLSLEPNANAEWMLVSEINQDSTDVANLNYFLKNGTNLKELLIHDINKGTENLRQLVAKSDGIQTGNEQLCYARHFSNTLFNVMRGGIVMNNYTIDSHDFKLFVKEMNRKVFKNFITLLESLPKEIDFSELIEQAQKINNTDFIRICYEYLPLTFSRRHGDPSRPWNIFSIETKNSDGSLKFNYQGNWRDIFQNWEALSLSYPGFIESMLSKFLNASTADGYNPYRISREGIDWETPDPQDPWAYIGYWGDHQIIYLQKFLELSNAFHPGKFQELMTLEQFTYANVPYRIKTYKEIVKNPQSTIDFDFELNEKIKSEAEQTGTDARLVKSNDGTIYKANLTEKLLVTLLAKLSNFIPEAGIWLNTQRPEWNDANNALVGSGVSMVTLYYIRRFLNFVSEMFDKSAHEDVAVSKEIVSFLDATFTFLESNKHLTNEGFTDSDRLRFADTLGNLGSHYRSEFYANGFSGSRTKIKTSYLVSFAKLCLKYVDQSIKANKRSDNLYHAYNLISFDKNGVSVRNLYEMLEGQVAVLSSGYLSDEESLDVLNGLKWGNLFRKDQYSYLLYPDRQLPLFIEKNTIPDDKIKASDLLSRLLADKNNEIIKRDITGKSHFNGLFRNAAVLSQALDQLGNAYAPLVAKEKELILEIYESMFDHKSFTGRSGTFYGFEGLGCIYWHMVSKLLLATQECYFRAVKNGSDPVITGKIKDHYYEIKAGIGLYKSPGLYGAFPTDAYSHTPMHAGAQQPGMTGQVKEDILSRMGELGLHIERGEIIFDTALLNQNEILVQKEDYNYFDVNGNSKTISLEAGQLGFTFCQVAVCYTITDMNSIRVIYTNGDHKTISDNRLPSSLSKSIFDRKGEVERIEVALKH